MDDRPAVGRNPDWWRPENVLGEPVPLTLLLGRSEVAAVQLQHLTAYRTGFEFQIVAHYRTIVDTWDPMHGLAGLRRRPGATGDRLDDDHLRLRLRFSDGSEVDNLGPPMMPTAERPRGPLLRYLFGEGGGVMASIVYWIWPLPPPGPLVVSCEWPQAAIPVTERQVDADLIRAASLRAIELWPTDA